MSDGGRCVDDTGHLGGAKVAAVEMWKDAVRQVSNPRLRMELSALDIHDKRDRIEIEELIEHEVPDEDYLALHDAFDDLHNHFEEVWG